MNYMNQWLKNSTIFKDNIWAADLAGIEWLDNNDVLMYSTQNEGKSVIAEKFIKTLKAKIY